MPILIDDDGQEIEVDVEFVSNYIHNAYRSGQSWDSDNYIRVELGSIICAWITKSENEHYQNCQTLMRSMNLWQELECREYLYRISIDGSEDKKRSRL